MLLDYSKPAEMGSPIEAKILAFLEGLSQAKVLCLSNSNLNVEEDYVVVTLSV